jgi:hypothetical protein
VDYQKRKSTVHQSHHRKPTGLLEDGLSVTEGSSNYPYMIVRPQGDVRNHRTKLSVPGVTLAYQTTPPEFRGDSAVLPNSHVSLGQHVHTVPLVTCTDAAGHANKCLSFCCSPLSLFS